MLRTAEEAKHRLPPRYLLDKINYFNLTEIIGRDDKTDRAIFYADEILRRRNTGELRPEADRFDFPLK
jgi:hypothetical protein